MPKTLGMIGGIAPGSTIEYYRLIVEAYRRRNPDGSYPPVIINSIDLQRMLALIAASELARVTAYLAGEVEKLARAGAKFGLLASNTPHLVFGDIQSRSSLPLISIVEAACDAAATQKLKTVGLFGTRFTMQGRFYPDLFSRRGITMVAPCRADQEYLHGKYMAELINGVFSDETRQEVLKIAARLKEEAGIQGIVLGGTELPLLLPESSYHGIPFLDTTRIHVERAVTEMLS